MAIILDLQPEIEKYLLEQATARGLSLTDFVKELVVREVQISPQLPPRRTGQELIDVCAQVHGLAGGLDIARTPSSARPVDFS